MFVLIIYFLLCISRWAILCLKWHFTVRLARNDAALTDPPGDKNKGEAYSSLTQLAAWGLPALQTVAVLVARLVDADELLGNYDECCFLYVCFASLKKNTNHNRAPYAHFLVYATMCVMYENAVRSYLTC